MRAAFTYGGEVMIENPRHSDYWKQAFIADFEKFLPEGRVWRDVELNMCRVGSPYFKAMRFRTTALGPVIAHMELKCNHEKRHPSCTGRDASGVFRTKSTAAYTKDFLAMLITVAAILAGLAMVSSMPSVGGEMLKMEDSFASEGRYWDSGGVHGLPAIRQRLLENGCIMIGLLKMRTNVFWHRRSCGCTGIESRTYQRRRGVVTRT